MKQSPNDLKTYQAITLSNGLRVLLVHNNETEKSAAALAVNVGHFSDPKDRQGLAHFLEHLLFLGTEKYPDGSEYQKFISQYGGNNNAWTATEHTCFFFDIHHDYFEQALDRFSQFFSAPLLSNEFIQKERQNIDAEFKLKLKDDIRRLYDVHKETINQKHPFSQFSVGDLDTLNDRKNSCLRDEVVSFFERYYRANYMTLAIEGPQSIAELKTLAEQKFSAIKTATAALPAITVPLYLPENLAVKINIKPVKNDRKLILSFAMPSIDEFYLHKPESILSYLLGHESAGSILSLLKQKQWAMALTAGSGINGSNFKDFNISMSLTELGEQHIDDIVDIIFGYINLLKNTTLATYYYQEKQAIAELSFQFYEKTSPIDSVCQLVVNMQHYPIEDYIFGDYVMTGMDHAAINELLNYLSSNNMRIIHVSQQNYVNNSAAFIEGNSESNNKSSVSNYFDKISFWYQVPYKIVKLPVEKLNYWQHISANENLYLPSKNPYIIQNPQVLSIESNNLLPELIENSNGMHIWYKQDLSFKIPKGHIYIGIDSPNAITSVENIAMSRLFVDLYSDDVVEENYDAELAGIHYHLYAHQGGITLQLAGISEKQPLLLERLLTKLNDFQCAEERFNLFKKQLINHWKNASTSKSISQLFSKLSSVLQPNNPSSKKLANVLALITFEQYQKFSQQFFQEITIDVLIHGNWHQSHANNISQIIKRTFNHHYDNKFAVSCPVIDIQEQGDMVLPLTLPEHDHASVVYYPCATKDLTTVASIMLLSQLLSPAFFQQMRTEKQYGYLVGVGYIPINRYPGIAFYIQSPETDAHTLTTAIDEFIDNSLDLINEISAQQWQQLKQGLAGQLQEKDTSLRIKSQRFWMSICNKDLNFDHKTALINTILALTLEQIKKLITEQLLNSSTPDRISLISLKNKPETHKNNDLNKKTASTSDFTNINRLKY